MAAILDQKELDARAQAGLVAQPGQQWGTKGDCKAGQSTASMRGAVQDP